MRRTERSVECTGDWFVEDGKLFPAESFNRERLVSGTSYYEVLRVIKKTPLFLEDHIERLLMSAKPGGAEIIPGAAQITENTDLILDNSSMSNQGNIRILLHYQTGLNKIPVICVCFVPHYYPSGEEYDKGVPVILVSAERVSVHSKVINLDFRNFIRQKIESEAAFEALLVSRDGYITEGSKSNIFMIANDLVVTPPVRDVLPGITRKYVMQICRDLGINLSERKIHHTELKHFNSSFITGTSPGIIAVKNIGTIAYTPKNEILERLSEEYMLIRENYLRMNRK